MKTRTISRCSPRLPRASPRASPGVDLQEEQWQPKKGTHALALPEPVIEPLARLIRMQAWVAGLEVGKSPCGQEWERLRTGVPEKYLNLFDHLRANAKTAVARLSATGACGGCHLNLPGALASRIVHAGGEIHVCPHCGCILHVASVPDGSNPALPEARAQPGKGA